MMILKLLTAMKEKIETDNLMMIEKIRKKQEKKLFMTGKLPMTIKLSGLDPKKKSKTKNIKNSFNL